jgi:hypothetical protein
LFLEISVNFLILPNFSKSSNKLACTAIPHLPGPTSQHSPGFAWVGLLYVLCVRLGMFRTVRYWTHVHIASHTPHSSSCLNKSCVRFSVLHGLSPSWFWFDSLMYLRHYQERYNTPQYTSYLHVKHTLY